jgi:hypothetical protein
MPVRRINLDTTTDNTLLNKASKATQAALIKEQRYPATELTTHSPPRNTQ